MTSTCQILNPTTTIDNAGGRSTTWASEATVACRFGPSGAAQELEMAARLGVVAPYTFHLPHDTNPPAAKKRLVADGHTFEVAYSFPVATNLYEVRVLAKEIL